MKKRCLFFILLLLFLWLLTDTGLAGRKILYDSSVREEYGQILRQQPELVDFSVEGRSRYLFSALNDEDVAAVELYDVQADILLRNTRQPYYWYPHYTTRVVFALAPTSPFVDSWQELLERRVTVSIPTAPSLLEPVVTAMGYGLSGKFDARPAIRALEKMEQEGRLRTDSRFSEGAYLGSISQQPAQVQLMLEHLLPPGQPLRIVVPKDGTVLLTKGLLSKVPLGLQQEKIQKVLIDKGYPSLDGTGTEISQPEEVMEQAATLSDRVRQQVFGRYRLHGLLGVRPGLFYLVFLVLGILWGGGLRQKILQQGVRRALDIWVLTFVLWIVLRFMKLSLPPDFYHLERYLWYGFYLCFGLLFFLADWIAWASGRNPEEKFLPKGLRILAALNGIFFLLVVTNDGHRLVFDFPRGLMNGSHFYRYGPLYYCIAGGYALEFLGANLFLLQKAKKQRMLTRRAMAVLVWSGLYGLYAAGYARNIPLLRSTEITLITALWAYGWLELLLWSHLLPANSAYEDCFTQSHLGLSIWDRTGNCIYRSGARSGLVQKNYERRTMPITGGQVVWYEDRTELKKQQRILELTSATLSRALELSRQKEKMERRRIQQKVQQSVYRDVEKILQSKAGVFQRYAGLLAAEKPGKQARTMISRLNVLASFLKKSCVLLLRGREDGTVSSRELKLAVQELCHYLEGADLKTLLSMEGEGSLDGEGAQALLTFLEGASEEALGQDIHFQICRLWKSGEDWHLSLLWDKNSWSRRFYRLCQQKNRDPRHFLLAHKELDYGVSLVLTIKGRG